MTSAQIYMANVGAMKRIDRRVTPWWLGQGPRWLMLSSATTQRDHFGLNIRHKVSP